MVAFSGGGRAEQPEEESEKTPQLLVPMQQVGTLHNIDAPAGLSLSLLAAIAFTKYNCAKSGIFKPFFSSLKNSIYFRLKNSKAFFSS